MKTSKCTAWFMIIGLLLVLSGCGKNIPAISPELLQSKQSVLVVSKPGLNEQALQVLQKTLLNWRDSRHIAFEWMQDVAALEEAHSGKIKGSPYDYILVIGNELTRQAAGYAAEMSDKRWILLDDALAQPAPVNGNHILWKQTGEGFVEKQWQEWVKQQQVIGKTIEWVTVSTNPIPSMWAPSEEAEYISLSDAEGWYPQFQLQVKRHYPDWIVVYSPLDATFLQRMKSLQVPVINMASTSVNIQWEPLMASISDMLQKQWTPGLQIYQPQEMAVNKEQ